MNSFTQLILISFLTVSTYTHAGNFSCLGIPQKVYSWKDGRVGVNLDSTNKIWILCNNSNNDGCSAVLSTLLSAKVTKSPVQLVIFDNTYNSCETTPSWQNISSDFDYIVAN